MQLSSDGQDAVLQLVRNFKQFTPDNDPYDEHDFGMVEYQGDRYFWKFDYYDRNMEFGSPEPSDPEQTIRALTVFLSSEY